MRRGGKRVWGVGEKKEGWWRRVRLRSVEWRSGSRRVVGRKVMMIIRGMVRVGGGIGVGVR